MSRFHTPSVRCTSVCTMEQIISCLRPSLYYQAPSRRIHFLWKRKSFFFLRFSKIVFPHVEFLCRFCPSRCVRFRLKAQKLFPFLIIYPSTRGVFDTVTSSFQKAPFSRIYTRKHENSAITREPIASEKFHFFIILRYFDQDCLFLVIIWLHSFADGNSSKVVTGWRKYRNPQSRNWKID